MAEFFGSGNDDEYVGSAESDLIVGDDGNDSLSGLAGADSIFGGADNDIIRGGAGFDVLSGDSGNDTIYGGRGFDQIVGDFGLDLLFGGGGDDQFILNHPDNFVEGEVYDGGAGFNELYNDTGIWGAFDLDLVTIEEIDAMRFKVGSGALTVNMSAALFSDGNFTGAGAGFFFGETTAFTTISMTIAMGNERTLDLSQTAFDLNVSDAYGANVTITGTGGKDKITTAVADDIFTVKAKRGADIIDLNGAGIAYGGAGADVIRDSASFRSSYGGGGADRIFLTQDRSFAYGGGGADTLLMKGYGTIARGDAGDDLFVVHDRVQGIYGGDGFDTVDFSRLPVSGFTKIGVSMQNNTLFMYLDDGSTFTNIPFQDIEHVIGTDADDQIVGSGKSVTLNGGAGNDFISTTGSFDGDEVFIGGAGDDRILDGSTRDKLFGGAGDDEIEVDFALYGGTGHAIGGAGDDTLVFLRPNANYTLDLRDWTLKGFENFTVAEAGAGNEGTVILTAAQLALAVATNGTLDISWRDGGVITVDIRMAGETALDLTALDISASSFNMDFIIQGGRVDEAIVGAVSQQNTIVGKGGDDELIGGDREDLLKGGGGNDILSGGLRDDLLVGGGGQDQLTGGLWDDVFLYTSANESGVGRDSRDIITDFTLADDLIDIKAFASSFAGYSAFTGTAGEARAELTGNGLNTRLFVDTDGDSTGDFEVLLLGVTALTQTQLILDL